MQNKLRVDFNLFKKPEPEKVSGGLVAGTMESFMCDSRELKSVIDNVKERKTVWWVSEGEWSMHQLLLSILNFTGPASVFISSYAMGETPARILSQLKQDGTIRNLYCLLDDRVDVRSAAALQLVTATADHLKLVATHAKVTLINNSDWNITVLGSANYTENRRYESGVVTCDIAAYEHNNKWMTKALNACT